jgi:hypothetical protein
MTLAAAPSVMAQSADHDENHGGSDSPRRSAKKPSTSRLDASANAALDRRGQASAMLVKEERPDDKTIKDAANLVMQVLLQITN